MIFILSVSDLLGISSLDFILTFSSHFDYDIQIAASPHHTPADRRGVIPGDILLDKLEEVTKSVKVRLFYFHWR